jgi:ABC-type multidrug transport system ATPase subunit
MYSQAAPRAEDLPSPGRSRSGIIGGVSNGALLLEAIDLRKSYGSHLVLDGVSLSVNAGEVVGLLGPNGAGKTTTLSILATLLEPDAGLVRIAGATPSPKHFALRRRLGFVPQSIALYPSLSGLQNLEFFARLHGIPKRQAQSECMRVLHEVGLADRAQDPVEVLSGGMKRRLNLACGMVHGPDLLLLDEPTVGVDPQSRDHILETVRRAAAAGAGVIYSTHYMEEVERICSRAMLIDSGKVVAAGTDRIRRTPAADGDHLPSPGPFQLARRPRRRHAACILRREHQGHASTRNFRPGKSASRTRSRGRCADPRIQRP